MRATWHSQLCAATQRAGVGGRRRITAEAATRTTAIGTGRVTTALRLHYTTRASPYRRSAQSHCSQPLFPRLPLLGRVSYASCCPPLPSSSFPTAARPRSYACYLTFQLKTHSELFKGDDDDAVPMMTVGTSIGALTVITAIVAVCSEFLTDSIEEVSAHTGISETFIGEEAGDGRG